MSRTLQEIFDSLPPARRTQIEQRMREIAKVVSKAPTGEE